MLGLCCEPYQDALAKEQVALDQSLTFSGFGLYSQNWDFNVFSSLIVCNSGTRNAENLERD